MEYISAPSGYLTNFFLSFLACSNNFTSLKFIVSLHFSKANLTVPYFPIPRHTELPYLPAKQLEPGRTFRTGLVPPHSVSGSPHKSPTGFIIAQFMRPS